MNWIQIESIEHAKEVLDSLDGYVFKYTKELDYEVTNEMILSDIDSFLKWTSSLSSENDTNSVIESYEYKDFLFIVKSEEKKDFAVVTKRLTLGKNN